MSSAPIAPPPARLRRPQWQLAVQTLDRVLHQARVADASLQEAFRARAEMGSRDRARVSDLVYGVLRDLRALQALAGDHADSAATLCALQSLRSGLADVEMLVALGVAEAPSLAQKLSAIDAASLTPAQRNNLPDAIDAAWRAQYGDEETDALAQALRATAPVDLRVNTLKATRAAAQAALAQSGIEAQATSLSPWGLRLSRRVALQSTPAFRDGWVEPQDEGSQLLALLVGARPGEQIADWCAGAGGKTLALAAAMEDSGRLWAMDADAPRLARLGPRLRRAGVRCVQTQVLVDDVVPPALANACDAVLVDAPCSGSGTWRRQPDARLRLPDFAVIGALQRRILAAAAQAVRPGGRLVYATCSLIAVENDAVVDDFLRAHPQFEPEDAGTVLAAHGVTLPGARLRLLPHRHGTDGFFAVRLVRRG
jgi:16S rRNA (cytosine967-C5)-methyltransferase